MSPGLCRLGLHPCAMRCTVEQDAVFHSSVWRIEVGTRIIESGSTWLTSHLSLLFCLCYHLITSTPKMSHSLPHPTPKILLREGKGALCVKQYHCASRVLSTVPTWFPGHPASLFLRRELRWSKEVVTTWRSAPGVTAEHPLPWCHWRNGESEEAELRRLKPRAL